MPATAITFIIGGLALAGFPLVTAGFWSKDEILADAWVNQHFIVFVVLALAALLTAFYTARQIMMTFFGKPRTAAAAMAGEKDGIFRWMTIPLMVLAVFAVAFGWLGIPETFPLLGRISSNPFFQYTSRQAEAIEVHAEQLPFAPVPLVTSLVVALGGLFLGWLVYRNYAKRGEHTGSPLAVADPMARRLGGIYPILQHKYYFDELYRAVFVKNTQRLSNWLYRFDDLWVIDPIVEGVGKLGLRFSEMGRWFDTHVVDATANGIATITGTVGSAVRSLQTGKAQNYLLVGLVAVSALLAAFLLLPK
jgi:NADH-quinone oxidoreductase subunit L